MSFQGQKVLLCGWVALTSFLGSALLAGEARAETREEIAVQGVLRDGAGALESGAVSMTVSLYASPAGGAALWSESLPSVPVIGGVFTVVLGRTMAMGDALFSDRGSLYLGVAIDGGAELTRQPLTATGFARHAGVAGRVGEVTTEVADRLIGGACPTGQYLIEIGADGSLVCASVSGAAGGDITGVEAGDGLEGGGTTGNVALSVDLTAVQSRVLDECPAGQSIRRIFEDGTVDCEVDTDTDTNTTYSSGAGLQLTGTQFSIDVTYTQRRVTGVCPAGESIRQINADGTVACEVDTDTNTTYSSGFGLSLAGTTFAINTAQTQQRVSSTCPAGESIRQINADGTVVCEVDTDTNTTYSNGFGLSLAGTQFAINTAVTQRRVVGTCAAGTAVRWVNEDGTVHCGGLSIRRVESAWAFSAGRQFPYQTYWAYATCAVGEIPISGGGECGGGSGDVVSQVTGTYPEATYDGSSWGLRTWTVACAPSHAAAVAYTGQARAHVYCMTLN